MQQEQQDEKKKQAEAEQHQKQQQEEERRAIEESMQIERERQRAEIKERLKDEPAEGDDNAVLFLFRLPDGSRITRRFLRDDKAQVRASILRKTESKLLVAL